MEHTSHRFSLPWEQVDELLDTVRFSLETVRMALSIGRRSRNAFLALNERVQSTDPEEREAGLVAIEALDHAREAFLDLAELLDEPEHLGLGLDLRFWSAFEWCWFRLFTESVRTTGQAALKHELVEAGVRAFDLQHDLRRVRSDVRLPH